MTNPHPTTPTDIDIRVSADQVIAQLQQGRHAEALRLLERQRADERPVVQEALDRYVAAGARTELDLLHRSNAFQAIPELAPALERLQQATQPPRMPDHNGREPDEPNELVGLTDAQKYDVYASMVETRGNQAASDALRNGESVLLGLRKETSTLSSMDDPRTPIDESQIRRGTGIYDDHIVVLRKDANGERHWFIADRASTEPTAQYDHHAGSDGSRVFNTGRIEARRIEPSPGYGSVMKRKIEGSDVDGDSYRDLGRLAEGTFEMAAATHPNPQSARTNNAFRPSPEQLAPERRAGLVQRDTNADGWFTQADVNGVQALNSTFKIHSGSFYNTDSAGCQTIHPEDYRGFIDAARANPRQTRWQYVLTSTEGGPFHNVDQGMGQQQPHQPRPFNDPFVDRYFAAVMAGDSDLADRIAIGFAQSREGQQLVQAGDRLLAQQQTLEQQQEEARQQVQQGPGMRT